MGGSKGTNEGLEIGEVITSGEDEAAKGAESLKVGSLGEMS